MELERCAYGPVVEWLVLGDIWGSLVWQDLDSCC